MECERISKDRSIKNDFFCVLFCETKRKEKDNSQVLKSIQEKTTKLKVSFFLVFFTLECPRKSEHEIKFSR
jgi:hypothetical protein